MTIEFRKKTEMQIAVFVEFEPKNDRKYQDHC